MMEECPNCDAVYVAASPPQESGVASWPEPGTIDVRTGPDGRLWLLWLSGVGPWRAAIPMGPGAALDLADRLALLADTERGRRLKLIEEARP